MATIVAFHAHPDDEALLTGGTLARLAAGGHRVIIAVACDGAMGPATDPGAGERLAELRASAAILRVARVEHLGYADSGHGPVLYPDPPDRPRFARAALPEAAGRLAALLREEQASILISYDANGGYGHRDHVRVHEVGARAAELAGPVRILEATLPRERVVWPMAAARLLHWRAAPGAGLYSPRSAITHRLDVRRYCGQKRAALAAHRSQLTRRSRSGRVFRLLVRLPLPVFGLLLGHEWFTEPGLSPGGALRREIV
jgi:LmbE family N-acetylglucosaminyl deacetylase